MRVTLFLFTLLTLGNLAVRGQATDFLLNDFESGGSTNNLFGYWFYYNDAPNKGNSRILTCDSVSGAFDSSSLSLPGYGGSAAAGRMGWAFGDKNPSCGDSCSYDPEVGFGTDLRSGDSVANLTGATAITFWAKANKAVKILFVINLNTVKDYSNYRQTLDVGTDWRLFTVNLKASAAFAQPTWGKPVAWDPTQVTTINWVATMALNKTLASDTLIVDDIKILGWDPLAVPVLGGPTAHGSNALRMESSPFGLRLTLPEALRARDGQLRIDDLGGRQVARARYRKGQETVIITPENMRRTQGPLFARPLER
jgi:hypothetical protein